MSRYDLTRASDLALLAVVRGIIGDDAVAPDGTVTPITRRCLRAFAQELIDDPREDFDELEALRAECREQTLTECEREIGHFLRGRLARMPGEEATYADPLLTEDEWRHLRSLVHASRSAPEDAP